MIIQTQEERDILREGGRRLAAHVRVISEMVRPGFSSFDLERVARERVESDGDTPAFLGHKGRNDKHGYPSALCVSVNDVIVHSPASENATVFKEGDVVSIDFGIRHRGLYTDHAVTLIAGSHHAPEDLKLVRGTHEALLLGIEQARVGNYTGDIGYAVERFAKANSFGFPKNLSGHGVGRAVHEEPYVPNFGAPKSGTELVEGMVIAIEPMFTLGKGDLFVDADGHSYRTKDGSRAAHAEHTVLITADGPEILTKE
jgi:methionyl aminopeptidase